MDFSKSVKKALIDKEKTTAWLAERVREKTGMFCDAPYISRILSGDRSPEKIIQAINEILEIDSPA